MFKIEDDKKLGSLISILCNNYEALYFLNFDDGTIEPYRLSDTMDAVFGDYVKSKPYFAVAMKEYIDNYVSKSDKDGMRSFLDVDFIKNELQKRDTIFRDFAVEIGDKVHYYRVKISRLSDENGNHHAAVGFANISMEMEHMNSFRQSAAMISKLEKDSLTGLYNKEFFFKKADEYIEEHPDEDLIIWVSDVQGLKVINEKYGEATGDQVLKMMATEGMNNFYGYIFGGRIEGDKFCALIHNYNPDIYRINKAVPNGSPAKFPVPNVIIKHGVYYVSKENPISAQGMYDRAMLALNSIKDKYGTNIAEYDDNFRKELLLNRLIMENAESGLEREEFHIFYQKKHDAHTEAVVGAEALVRWIHPELGFMSPGLFIPLFEKNGFISKLDFYVWEAVCKALHRWIEKGIKVVPISINVSRRDFDDVDLADKFIAMVDGYDIPHELLHIEVTESAYSDDPKIIIDTVNRLHNNGFIVELDDFGTGYSSMLALGSMDLDIMKLDMSLVQEEDLGSEKSLLKFSMQLAQMMQLKTVAEGVETEAQAERIRELGGDVIQGYLLSKPLSEEEFEDELSRAI